MSPRKEREKRASVTFVADEDVVQHIVPINDKIAARNTKRTKSRSTAPQTTIKDLEDQDDDSDEENEENVDVINQLPKELAAGADNLTGKDVFTFQTPKKSGQMNLKASEAATPKSDPRTPTSKTPSSRIKHTGMRTPTSKTPTTPVSNKPHTSSEPVARLLQEESRKPQVTTPYRLRMRNLVDESGESSDESLDSSDDENPADKDAKTTPHTPSVTRRCPDIDVATSAEQYFDIHSSTTNVTSDRTLAKLGSGKMDAETLCSKLSSVDVSHMKQCTALMEEYRGRFRKWMLYLCNDFNILLYGLGSKHTVLEDFRSTMLADFTHVVVNGYFPSLTIKQIVNTITEDVLDHSGTFRTPVDQVHFIKDHFDEADYRDVYLIIHNIDGAMLRGEKCQSILSLLSQVRGLHIVASVDHINSSLIWDKTTCSRFNWLWQDVTTYLPYTNETSYENSLLVQQTGSLALSSLSHVMRSLTPNARGIFMLLVKYQLDSKDVNSYNGMSFQDLYQRCRESFLVNSDLTLRTQLTEFRDHKLIRSKKGYDGTEYLVIPIEEATLTEFLDSQADT